MEHRIKKSVLFIVALFTLLVLVGMPGCKGITSSLAAEYNNKGAAFIDDGKYDDAITQFSLAIEVDPKYVKAYVNRGYAYLKKQQYGLAIADYTQAIKLDPKNAIAYNGRGSAYTFTRQWELAFSDFNKAIEIDPNFTQALTNRDMAAKMLNITTTPTATTPTKSVIAKTLAGEWTEYNGPGSGLVLFDENSLWNYDVILTLYETGTNTFNGTMQTTLRSVSGPASKEPQLTSWLNQHQVYKVGGTRDGAAVKLNLVGKILRLAFNGDYLSGDTKFYDPGGGTVDVQPTAGLYITWIYRVALKRK